MCCLFGLYDYGGTLSAKQKNRMIAALAAASEVRGIDATGIAYCMNGHLSVYKRPLPAHWMRFRIPEQAAAVMGHTRMTTQGSEYRNYNNHPFSGKAGQPFALAHNSVLTNDGLLRRQEKLPVSKIETDSFIIVQLLEQAGSIGFQTLRTASEQLAGSFTYTVLDGGGRLYIVRGNNPFCLYHWPGRGLYLYASTQAVLDAAVFKIRKLLSGSMQKIPVEEGEILRLSPDGSRASETFSMKKLYQFQLCQSPYYGSCWPDVQDNTGYAEELRRMAPAFGFSAKDVDTLLRGGMLPEEIEEYFYCTEGREDVWFGMCSDS